MDIYNADKQLSKVIEFLQSLSDSPANLYLPTRLRLKELSSKANTIVGIIINMLQDELMEDTVEFDTSDKNLIDINQFIQSVEVELNKLKQFAGTSLQVKPSSGLSPESKRRIIAEYGKAFKMLSMASTPYPHVNNCIALLWKWFDTRFNLTARTHPNFHYNIRRIPMWVRDIVVLYGDAVAQGTTEAFIESFDVWCDSLYHTDAGDRFAVPYDIYCFDTNIMDNINHLSLTAVVLWDMLVDLGLHNVCTDSDSDAYLTSDAVYELCKQYNPEVLDPYVNYTDDRSILSVCKLVGGDTI